MGRTGLPSYPTGVLDTRNPVNWDHPGNTGLVFCSLGYPNVSGGRSWPDLTNYTQGSTLVSGAGWIGAANGQQGVFLNGLNQYASVTGSLTLTSATISCWAYRTATWLIGTGIVFSRGGGGNTSGMSCTFASGANNGLGYTWNDDGGTYGWDSGIRVPMNQWVYLVVTVAPTVATVYLCNNIITSASNVRSHTSSILSAINIGTDTFDMTNRSVSGGITGVSILNRAISFNEVVQTYQLAQSPGTDPRLNFVRPWVSVTSAVVPTFNPAWATRSNIAFTGSPS